MKLLTESKPNEIHLKLGIDGDLIVLGAHKSDGEYIWSVLQILGGRIHMSTGLKRALLDQDMDIENLQFEEDGRLSVGSLKVRKFTEFKDVEENNENSI